MIFQAMKEGSRIVQVYRKEAQYEIDDETQKAFKFSGENRVVQIPYTAALSQIAGYQEQDSRVYRYEVKVSARTFNKWFGFAMLFGSILFTYYLYISGRLL